MSKFDPRTKLFGIIITTSLAIYIRDAFFLLLLFVGAMGLCLVFRADYKMFINKVRKFLYLFLVVSILQIVFIRTGMPILELGDFVLVTSDGLDRGLSMGLRFMIIFSSAAIMASENSRYVIASFSKMHIPYMFSFMLMITLRFLPIYMESFKDAMVAIQLRGINFQKIGIRKKIKLYGHLLLPVVSEAIVKSQELAMTMEARGFGALKKRTTYLEVNLAGKDFVCMTAIGVIYIGLVYWYLI